MNKATNPVLEVLRAASGVDIWLSKSDIWRNIKLLEGEQPSKNTVYRTFDNLTSYGMIETTSVGPNEPEMMQITERGVSYLEGDLDASRLTTDDTDDSESN